MIRVAVSGAAGRMGETVCSAVEGADDMRLVGRADPALGTALSEVLADADVVVDFTRPDVALENALGVVAACEIVSVPVPPWNCVNVPVTAVIVVFAGMPLPVLFAKVPKNSNVHAVSRSRPESSQGYLRRMVHLHALRRLGACHLRPLAAR